MQADKKAAKRAKKALVAEEEIVISSGDEEDNQPLAKRSRSASEAPRAPQRDLGNKPIAKKRKPQPKASGASRRASEEPRPPMPLQADYPDDDDAFQDAFLDWVS